MLAIGEWYINLKTHQLFKQNDDNQPLNLNVSAVKALVFLSENQHRLVQSEQLQQAITAQDDEPGQPRQPAGVDEIITAITQCLGNNALDITADRQYLLKLPVFTYQYTPITAAQMKAKLASQQAKTLTAQPRQSTALTTNDDNQTNPSSTTQKVVAVALLVILVVGFLLSSP